MLVLLQRTLKGFSYPLLCLMVSCVFRGHEINILYDVQMSYKVICH